MFTADFGSNYSFFLCASDAFTSKLKFIKKDEAETYTDEAC